MNKLMVAITQDVTVDTTDIDLDDIDNHSDIHMIETEDGSWLAVRTTAIEEQSLACQLILLLIEKLQEYYYVYIDNILRIMIPLLKSSLEDIRSYAMLIVPEIIRCTAKATAPDQAILKTLIEYIIGHLLIAIESETLLELIITGLQALKYSLQYANINWITLQLPNGSYSSVDPPLLTPEKSTKLLNLAQLEAITATCKVSISFIRSDLF